MPQRRNDDDGESRRILQRIAGESEPGGASFAVRKAKGALDRVSAADADRSDAIEYWGTRIGRVLGLLLAIGLMIWLVIFLTRGG
ncbi:MAG TPA: hypothetical protein VGM46_02075 [Mesorhizobium sp.]|jgi:hypothetical protein